jgi:phosphate transport system substrate-binding protein
MCTLFRNKFKPLQIPAILASFACVVPHALAAFPVDPALPSYEPRAVQLSSDASYVLPDGSIRIAGAEHVDVIVEGFNELFARTHAGFKFLPQLKGTTTGMPLLTYGVTLFAPLGREVNNTELVPYEKIVGAKPIELRAAHDSNTSKKLATNLAVYVNKSNPIDHLTTEQLARIFATGHAKGDITQWGQAGAQAEWTMRAIHPYGTPEYTGFGNYMQKQQLAGLPPTPALEQYGNTEQILKHVSEDPAGIGVAASGRLAPQLKQVAVAAKDGEYSAGSVDDVISGKYAFGRYVYFYVRRTPNGPVDPVAKEYMRLVFSKQGQAIIASQPDGYIPLTAQEAAAELSKLD